MRFKLLLGTTLFSALSCLPVSALSPSGCAVGARCLSVDQDGHPDEAGTFIRE